jgi:very-short-patch-repair endonuclease
VLGVNLEVALHKCGGVARWSTLRELGVPPHVLRAARPTCLVARGTFALPGTPAALVAAVRLGGVASHGSAAQLHGLGPWRPDPTLHVTVAAGSRSPVKGVRIHRGHLPSEDVDPFRPLTSPLRTVLDCARTMPLREALVVMDAALYRGLVLRAPLQAAADTSRGPGATALRRVVRFADELAASPLESVLRLLITLLDCELETQVRIPGLTAPVDFLLDGWLVVEPDGFEFHADRRTYRNDRARLNALAAQGYVLLRFTWEDVYFRPGWVLEQVARVLSLGPPRQ